MVNTSFVSWQRSAADQILRELQNNPDLWLQVVHILQNSQNLNTKFFALQVSITPVLRVSIFECYNCTNSLDQGKTMTFFYDKLIFYAICNFHTNLINTNAVKIEPINCPGGRQSIDGCFTLVSNLLTFIAEFPTSCLISSFLT